MHATPVFYTLTAMFAVGSWIATNAVWVQLPLMVTMLPEGWTLPSYLTVIIQVGNVGAVFFILLRRFSPKFHQKAAIFSLLVVVTISLAVTAETWCMTSSILNKTHSTALLINMFVMAFVNCSSNIVFMPFMSNFQPKFIRAYFVGSSFSSFIPSIIGLIQGQKDVTEISYTNISFPNGSIVFQNTSRVTSQPRYFNVTCFFWLIAITMIFATISFVLILRLPKWQRLIRSRTTVINPEVIDELKGAAETVPRNYESTARDQSLGFKMCSYNVILYLTINSVVNAFTDSILPSVQSYSSIPYSNQSYHLVITISSIASPLASIFAFFYIQTKRGVNEILFFVSMILNAYIVWLAASSPNPWMVDRPAGAGLMIAGSVVNAGLMSYLKSTCAAQLRHEGGEKGLLFCGISSQVGSFIGAIIIFPIVSVFHLLQSAE